MRTFFAISLVLAFGAVASAQNAASDLAFKIPRLYGQNGLILPNPFHGAHFESSFQQSFTPMNAAVGSQLALLPFASPASGLIYNFNSSASVYALQPDARSRDRGTRRDHRAAPAVSRCCLSVFQVRQNRRNRLEECARGLHPPAGDRRPVRTGHHHRAKFHLLNINQYTAVATFGLTDRLDISAAIPILTVHLGVVSNASIDRIAPPDPVFGQAHYFDAADAQNSTRKTFNSRGTSTGLGDITFRLKGTIWHGERGSLALAADVRTPTGDQYNFLGTGAVGFKPFLIASYRQGRVAPHVNMGFQWNGSSTVAGDLDQHQAPSAPPVRLRRRRRYRRDQKIDHRLRPARFTRVQRPESIEDHGDRCPRHNLPGHPAGSLFLQPAGFFEWP